MTFFFYSPVHFEDWDWRNSVEKGIGGSETSHVEMAWRLAQRGHKVICYAPIPKDCPRKWRGTSWHRFEDADFWQDGVWILYRCPEVLDKFGPRRPEQPRWLMCQDEDYGHRWTPDRADKIDWILAISGEHQQRLRHSHPELASKIVRTSNGIKMDLIREVEAKLPARNPKKLIYASSPDRGLLRLLHIFSRAQEQVPNLELHAFYGFNNIDKLMKTYRWMGQEKHRIVARLKSVKGVVWRGRVSQQELYREWLTAGIWCYPTNFFETSCITSMEAQALGAIPLTRPYGALRDNVMHGIVLSGDADDPLVQARYAGEIIRLAQEDGLQDRIRPQMMADARGRFNWERWVDQWEAVAEHYGRWDWAPMVQYAFQHRHARGKILNIGCAEDVSAFASRGATNIDIHARHPLTGLPTAAHILADARDLPKGLYEGFDTVILGDILEHFTPDDAVLALQQARLALRSGGRIVISCPDDARAPKAQHPHLEGDEEYLPGVSAFHLHSINRETLTDWLVQAGLQPTIWQELDYTHFVGHGIVAHAAH